MMQQCGKDDEKNLDLNMSRFQILQTSSLPELDEEGHAEREQTSLCCCVLFVCFIRKLHGAPLKQTTFS